VRLICTVSTEQENNKKTPVLFLAGFLLLTTCAFHTHIPFHPHTAHTVTDIARNFVICFFLSFSLLNEHHTSASAAKGKHCTAAAAATGLGGLTQSWARVYFSAAFFASCASLSAT
jgi:hypothetical protein